MRAIYIKQKGSHDTIQAVRNKNNQSQHDTLTEGHNNDKN